MKTEGIHPEQPGGEIILYQTEDGRTRIQVRMEDETVWLTIAQMAELFGSLVIPVKSISMINQVNKEYPFKSRCMR